MRKPQSQPSLAGLTEAEREQLADWVRREEYEVVRERVNKPRPEGFGLKISVKPLQTLYAKVALLDLINSRLPADKKLTLAVFETFAQRDILLLANADPSKIAEIHDTILNTVHDLAKSGSNTPTQLLALQRLADFPARAEIRVQRLDLDLQKFAHKQEMDAFRKEIASARFGLAKKSQAFREKQHEYRLTLAREKAQSKPSAFSPQPKPQSGSSKLLFQLPGLPQSDHLGPLATTVDEASERLRILWGVSKEEWARRTSLENDPYLRNGTTQDDSTPDPNLNLVPDLTLNPVNLVNPVTEISSAPALSASSASMSPTINQSQII